MWGQPRRPRLSSRAQPGGVPRHHCRAAQLPGVSRGWFISRRFDRQELLREALAVTFE